MANVNGGSNVSYGSINDGQTVTMNIPYTVPANAVCGSLHQVQINVSSTIGAQAPVTREFRLGAPVGGAPVTFTNNTALTIPDSGVSVPYGTTVVTSGLTGNKNLKLEITGLTHTFPGDLDYLLVGPGGQKFSLLSDSGSTGDVSNLTFTLSDGAAMQPSTTQWVAGDFKPVNITSGDTFPAPAPAGPYSEAPSAGSSSFVSVFGSDGSTMNGTWTLYLVDDAAGDLGSQAGWKLTFEANDFACSLTPSVKSRSDYDGDGKTDLSVFRPSEGNWYLNRSTAGFTVANWGLSSDLTTPGDFDGDNKADLAVFRPSSGTWFVLQSMTNTAAILNFGLMGDVPQAGDYDGDGKADFALFRPSTNVWYIRNSMSGSITISAFGAASDVPVRGDYDGDGKTDIAIFRPSTNQWWVAKSTGGVSVTTFGLSGDKLVPADYDGDNKDDVAIYRNGTWFILRSSNGAVDIVNFGLAADVPVPGDYDGDGKDDQAIYRNGVWWLNRSTAGVTSGAFGITTDIPTPSRYIP